MTAPAGGRVVALVVATAAGAPAESREAVDLVAGVGVAGDRYAECRGYWSDPRWPDQELTLVEAEVADALGIAPVALRRNVVTRGVALGALVGARFRLGDALIEGVRPCNPCAYIEQLNARPGLLAALAGCGGLRARIVEGGRVTVGDRVVRVGAASPG